MAKRMARPSATQTSHTEVSEKPLTGKKSVLRDAATKKTVKKVAKAKSESAAVKLAKRSTRMAASSSKDKGNVSPSTGMPGHQQAFGEAASQLIDQRIRELEGWRGETLARMRQLIHEADPAVVEEWKWMGTPVWSHDGILCTGESYKKVIKLTFTKGASLPDPSHLFNSSLEGNTRRAIDIQEGEKIEAKAFKSLIRAAVELNRSSGNKRVSSSATSTSTAKKNPMTNNADSVGKKAKPAKLLTGGNPQIAKADGDAPVQAYIAAMPGWKRDLGSRLDAIIVNQVPRVRKAVKWNSPFYGIEGQGWFLSFHVFTHYVKVTFFQGLSLKPVPPGGTERSKDARWIDIRETDQLDEARFADWVKQAAAIPGWIP